MEDSFGIYCLIAVLFKKHLNPLHEKDLDELTEEDLKVQDDFRSSFNHLKLFLNREEMEHKNLLNAIDNFLDNVKKEVQQISFKNNNNVEDLIQKAQIVLKNPWEQAKNEGSNKK